MELKEFMEEIVEERIQNLLDHRMKESIDAEKKWADEMDSILELLPMETREALENLLTQILEQEAEKGRYLYIAGIKDGAKISKALLA